MLDMVYLELAGFEVPLQFAEVFDDEFRPGRLELFPGVETGQHGARMNAAIFGRLNVVLHVADKERRRGLKVVLLEDFMDTSAACPSRPRRPGQGIARTR